MTKEEIISELRKKKVCPRCSQAKNLDEFTRLKGGPGFYCKPCINKMAKVWRDKKKIS